MPKSARALWHSIIQFDSLSDKTLGLYNLVKFGGAPLSEDINDTTVIHDDPRKAIHKAAMYEEYIRLICKLKVSLPFHVYTLDERGTRKYLMMKRVAVSMRSRSNNTITPHEGGYEIDPKPITVILAPALSGKSTYCMRNPWFVDADSILKWPSDDAWMEDTRSIRDVNIGIWQQLAEYKGSHILLHNGMMEVLPPYLTKRFNFISAVLPPEDIMARNTAASQRRPNVAGARSCFNSIATYAAANGVPTFSGFISATAYITNAYYRKVQTAYKEGFNLLRVNETALKLIAPDGVFRTWDTKPGRLSFGAHASMRIHTNEYARYSGITQHAWRHMTRHYPQAIVMRALGYKIDLEYTPCGHISKVNSCGVEISASGHMLGMLTWLAFPHSRVCGMPLMYPDFHTYIVMYLANQRVVTPSLEPYNPDIAYHRWVETLAGVLGSYVAIKILLKKGLFMSRRNAIMWKLYSRRIIRSIIINDRTWYLDVKFNRDQDRRFGPVHPR